ncbi:Atp-binding cassette sub-family g member 4 [Aix galericulata]|nr:Atp-binding cassette sub-family g member 4 [Aix galericulata]
MGLGLLFLALLATLGSGEYPGAAQDTYWSGTAPICLGGCKGKHKELKRSPCGAGSCCWLGYKSFCRGTAAGTVWGLGPCLLGPSPPPAARGPPAGSSPSPVNCGRPEADFHSLVHGNDWWVGSVVRYSCRPGYLLLGDPASACQPDGRWTPKPTCLRICLRGRIELSEREVSGGCSSSCSALSHPGTPSPARGCAKISSCVPKRPGWARWFLRCDRCECDCYVPCGDSQ